MYYLELIYKEDHTQENQSVEFHNLSILDCHILIEKFAKNYQLIKIKWEKE